MMPMIDAAAISVGIEIWKNIDGNTGGKVCAREPAVRNWAKANSFQQTMKLIAVATAMPGQDIGKMTRKNARNRVFPSTRAAASTVRGNDEKKLVSTQTIIGTVSVK